jgi:hypothetical protein
VRLYVGHGVPPYGAGVGGVARLMSSAASV